MTSIVGKRTPRPVARAEPVGSLLRNRQITDQIGKLYANRTTALRQIVLREQPQAVAEFNRIADDGAIPRCCGCV